MESDYQDMENAIAKAFDDPGWFCETILRIPNDPWQTELMEALAESLERYVSAEHPSFLSASMGQTK